MTTDTALGVTKLVVEDGISLSRIPYIVRIVIQASTVRAVPNGVTYSGFSNHSLQFQGIRRDALQ